MNSEQLKYFELAYEERNFSAAARRVPVSPQGLAKAIHSLEKELNVPLFENNEETGLPEPTEFAAELLEFAAVYQSNLRLLNESFDRIRGNQKADITLGCSLGVMGCLGPRFIEDYQLTHPGVRVHYREAADNQVEKDLADGLCELAIIVDPNKQGKTTQKLYQCPVYFWVRADDPLAQKEELTIEDFEGRDVALPGEGFKCYEKLTRFAKERNVELGLVYQMSEIFQLYEFAASGKGLGFSVRHLIDLPIFVRDASVVALPVKDWPWSFSIVHLDAYALGEAEGSFWGWCVNASRQLPSDPIKGR